MAALTHPCQWYGCHRTDTRPWLVYYAAVRDYLATYLCDEHHYLSLELGYIDSATLPG